MYLSNLYLPFCLSDYLSIFLSIYLSNYLSVCLSVYLSTYLSIRLSLPLSICLFIYPAICLSDFPSVCLSVYLSIFFYCLSIYLSFFLSERKQLGETSFKRGSWHVQNEASLRDCLKRWQHAALKRGNSARLPQVLTLTASKTKQFCETSFKNEKFSAELTAPYQCVLRLLRPISL